MKDILELYFTKAWLVAVLFFLAITSIKQNAMQPLVKIIPQFKYTEPDVPSKLHEMQLSLREQSTRKNTSLNKLKKMSNRYQITENDRKDLLDLISK